MMLLASLFLMAFGGLASADPRCTLTEEQIRDIDIASRDTLETTTQTKWYFMPWGECRLIKTRGSEAWNLAQPFAFNKGGHGQGQGCKAICGGVKVKASDCAAEASPWYTNIQRLLEDVYIRIPKPGCFFLSSHPCRSGGCQEHCEGRNGLWIPEPASTFNNSGRCFFPSLPADGFFSYQDGQDYCKNKAKLEAVNPGLVRLIDAEALDYIRSHDIADPATGLQMDLRIGAYNRGQGNPCFGPNDYEWLDANNHSFNAPGQFYQVGLQSSVESGKREFVSGGPCVVPAEHLDGAADAGHVAGGLHGHQRLRWKILRSWI